MRRFKNLSKPMKKLPDCMCRLFFWFQTGTKSLADVAIQLNDVSFFFFASSLTIPAST